MFWDIDTFIRDRSHPRCLTSKLKYVTVSLCVHAWLCLSLCDPMDCNLPGSSVHGIVQARTLEWVAISSSRGSSWLKDWTCISCISRRILYHHLGSPVIVWFKCICFKLWIIIQCCIIYFLLQNVPDLVIGSSCKLALCSFKMLLWKKKKKLTLYSLLEY